MNKTLRPFGKCNSVVVISSAAFLSLNQQIQGHVKYPTSAVHVNMNGEASVKFRVLQDYSISVVEIKGDNSWLNQYVKGQLQSKKVQLDEKDLNKTYEVTISFYVI